MSNPLPPESPVVTTHINLLQSIISRMANNSVSCKTWCLTLVAALLSIAGAVHNHNLAAFVLLPLAVFGFMDTRYLAQEIAYRDLYNAIVQKIRTGAYRLDDAFEAKAPVRARHILGALESWAIWPLYVGLAAAYFVALWLGWLAILSVR